MGTERDDSAESSDASRRPKPVLPKNPNIAPPIDAAVALNVASDEPTTPGKTDRDSDSD